ncbi:MAG TPA: fatty acid desaturase [Allosphingosinicella sp.]|jgi:beta-carotene ketolase (CrtW type)
MTERRQAAVGLALAAAIAIAWAALHVWSVFRQPLHGPALLAAPFLVAALCWLNVGLFIVAHDAMHGSLAPRRPTLNRWAGRVALAIYAGFSFDRLLPKHHAHHRSPGTADDPDFSEAHPDGFWRWYAAFFAQYFGLREVMVLTFLTGFYLFALGASYANLLVFWALPAILSSLQLFLFGTFLPHRHGEREFGDEHRARSNEYGWLASLLTCFHFGYHREHHLSPGTPWWRLPQARVRSAPTR